MPITDSLLILTYHAIDNRSSVISLSPEMFSWQMEQLAARGLTGISLADAFNHREKTGQFPADSVVLTFDDGYLSVLENALPAMERHGFSATVFLVTGMVGLTAAQARAAHPDFDRDLLDWEQARSLAGAGFEIGSHTISHPDLRRLPADELENELAGSRALLEQRLQAQVTAFAYPYGHFDKGVLAATSRYYQRACTTRLGRCSAASDSWGLERVDAWYLQRPQRFMKLINGGLAGWLHFRQQLRDLKRLAGLTAPGRRTPNPMPGD